LGVNIQITEDEEFDWAPSPVKAPTPLSEVPSLHNLGWLFAAAAALLLILAINHNWP
jgi:hypothetical protein